MPLRGAPVKMGPGQLLGCGGNRLDDCLEQAQSVADYRSSDHPLELMATLSKSHAEHHKYHM
tara:strand:+ start:142 stop:327 length:186 start_codon:yes stop_codon:yes gene_type:complete